jgi:hypothetical protein
MLWVLIKKKNMIKRILLSLLELTSENVIGKIGEKAIVSGLYRSSTIFGHEDEFIALSKGERFPPLGDGIWYLVVSC